MKRLFLASLVIILIAGLILGGCAEPAPEPAPAPAPAPSPSPAPAPEKTLELSFANWDPPECAPSKIMMEPWMQEINERTNGRVKIIMYYAEALCKAPDDYDALLSGIANIAKIEPSMTPGVFPLTEFVTLPMLWPNSEVAGITWWEMTEKYLMDTEYKDMKVLWVFPTGLAQIVNNVKQVRTPEDIDGMKFMTNSPLTIRMLEDLGASGISMAPPDSYNAIERGMVDGTLSEWEGCWIWHQNEVTKYRTGGLEVTLNCNIVGMNWDTWNSLPADIQQVFDETGGLKMAQFAGKMFDEECETCLAKIIDYDQKAGNPEIHWLSEAEKASWVNAALPIHDEWINEKEAEGLPAQALMDDVYALIQKY